MAVQLLMIPNPYPYGVDATQRSTIVEGQILPYTTTNPLLNITQISLTSNVVTFTCNNSLTGAGGQVVWIAGFSINGPLAFLNGAYTTASATSTTFTVSLTHANVAATACQALATLGSTYTASAGGLQLTWFTSLKTGLTIPVGTIGPLALPTLVEAFSLSGGLQSYVVKYTGTTVNLVNQKGGTEQTTGAFPADSIGFYAEWLKGGF